MEYVNIHTFYAKKYIRKHISMFIRCVALYAHGISLGQVYERNIILVRLQTSIWQHRWILWVWNVGYCQKDKIWNAK